MSQFKKTSSHEQVAAPVDMTCLGHNNAKVQSHKLARPAIKVCGKEDKETVTISGACLAEELAPNKCGTEVEVPSYSSIYIIWFSNQQEETTVLCVLTSTIKAQVVPGLAYLVRLEHCQGQDACAMIVGATPVRDQHLLRFHLKCCR
jgi:hypothetical protein